MSSTGNVKLPAVVTPQIRIPAPDETVTKEDIRQDLKDKRELKEVLRTASGASTLTKVALGVLGVHALAQTAKAISTPPPQLSMSPIQPQSDNSYTGVVNIPNCPDGTCPGILSLSRPASDIGNSVSLCQIDTSQCVGNVCKSSPECGLAAITAPKPDGSTQVTYTVSPKASGAFQMEYASEGRLATARYGLPPSPPGEDIATSKRGKRDTVECRDMAITNNGIAYIPQVPKNDPSYVYEQFGVIPSNLPYNRDREGGAVTFSNAAVRVANSPCNPVYRVYRWFGFSGYGRHLYWRENNPEIVNCIGGESGVRIPPGIRFSDGMEGMQPFNISSDDRCSPPDSAAYNCPDSKAFAPPLIHRLTHCIFPAFPKGGGIRLYVVSTLTPWSQILMELMYAGGVCRQSQTRLSQRPL